MLDSLRQFLHQPGVADGIATAWLTLMAVIFLK